jgi:hypothetical protein
MQTVTPDNKYTEFSFSPEQYEKNKDDCVVLVFDKPADKFQYIMHSNSYTGYCLFVDSNDETKAIGCTELRYVKLRIPKKYKRVPFQLDIPNVGVYYRYTPTYEEKVDEYVIFTSGDMAMILIGGDKHFAEAGSLQRLTMDVLDE